MNYDENVFKEKANIKARRIWLVFALLLTANYGTDAASGDLSGKLLSRSLSWLCWIPIFFRRYFAAGKGEKHGSV